MAGPHGASEFASRQTRVGGAFYDLTMGVAEGRIDKAAVGADLKRIAMAKPA